MKCRSLNTLFVIALTYVMTITVPGLEAKLASVKAAGMGLTAAAYPQDALAVAFNPAGMADIGDRYDVELFWDNFNGEGTIRGSAIPTVNGRFNGTVTSNYFSPDFGINRMMCICDWNMAFGLAVYNKDFVKTRYDHIFAPIIGTSNLKLEFIREAITPSWAIQIGDCHSFGVGLNIYVQRLRSRGLENFDNAARSSNPGHVTDTGNDWSEGVGVTLGWRSQLTDWFAFGIAYAPETNMSRFHKYSGFLAEHGRLNVPQSILGGILFSLIPCTNIAFDVEHISYDEIRSLNNSLATLLVPGNLGNKDGVGFGWRSQTVFRLGADYQLNDCWTLRAGYRYAKTPIRVSQTAVNLLTLETVEQYMTLGATWAFSECSEVSINYAHGFWNKVDGQNSVPIQLGGGEVDLAENRNVVGLAFGQRFQSDRLIVYLSKGQEQSWPFSFAAKSFS